MIKKENIELAKKNEFNSKADRWLFILIFFLGVVGIFYLKTPSIKSVYCYSFPCIFNDKLFYIFKL